MNIDQIIMICVVVVDVVLLLEILYFMIRRTIMNRLIQAAFEKNEEKFNSIADSFLAKIVSAYDKENVKFNVAGIQKDYSRVEESIARFEKMDLKKSQRKALYPKIFYHYIDRNRKAEAKKYYELLSEFEVSKERKNLDMAYDTYVLDGHRYLDEALKRHEKAKLQELPTLEKMISRMYENKKINSDAKKYERLAERHQLELENRQKRTRG